MMRQLGDSDLMVSPIGFGCWPISGVSTLDVQDEVSIATMEAAIEAGINFFDTAYTYGYNGESDRLLANIIKRHRDQIIVATKVGQYFDSDKTRQVDGHPARLREHALAGIKRLGLEQVDLLYLHLPDPQVPIAESAGAIVELIEQGAARYAAVSNVNAEQLAEFRQVCPIVAVQPPFNMLQQEAVQELRPQCLAGNVSIVCYWALMKGLLTGRLPRDHQFDPRDKRLTYPIYQGSAWERSQDFLDTLRGMAADLGCTVAQLVVYWTINQPAITVALCGAKRPDQIRETAGALQLDLDDSVLGEIDQAVSAVGPIP